MEGTAKPAFSSFPVRNIGFLPIYLLNKLKKYGKIILLLSFRTGFGFLRYSEGGKKASLQVIFLTKPSLPYSGVFLQFMISERSILSNSDEEVFHKHDK